MAGDYITLRIATADKVYSQFDFDQAEIVIGRHPGCDVVLQTPGASREHAIIARNGARFLLKDKGSLNGTTLNGEKISTKATLSHGDRIVILDTTIDVLFGSKQSFEAGNDKTIFVKPTKTAATDDEEEPSAASFWARLRRLFSR